MENQAVYWQPIPKLAKKYRFESIVEDSKSLIIYLVESKNKSNHLIITFDYSADSYQLTPINAPRILGEINFNNPDIISEWTFFTVKNSTFHHWAAHESYGIYDLQKFTHFLLITENATLDILTAYEPRLTYFSKTLPNPI